MLKLATTGNLASAAEAAWANKTMAINKKGRNSFTTTPDKNQARRCGLRNRRGNQPRGAKINDRK
jgi:hypothetical protein